MWRYNSNTTSFDCRNVLKKNRFCALPPLRFSRFRTSSAEDNNKKHHGISIFMAGYSFLSLQGSLCQTCVASLAVFNLIKKFYRGLIERFRRCVKDCVNAYTSLNSRSQHLPFFQIRGSMGKQMGWLVALTASQFHIGRRVLLSKESTVILETVVG